MIESVPLKTFYALHQLILIAAFSDGEDVLKRRTNAEIYGFGPETRSQNHLIAFINLKVKNIEKRKGLTGKKFYTYKLDYNKAFIAGSLHIQMHQDHKTILFEAIQSAFPDLSSLQDIYEYYCNTIKKVSSKDFQFDFIRVKGDKAYPNISAGFRKTKRSNHENLKHIADGSVWLYYFYEYEGSKPNDTIVMQLRLTIKLVGGGVYNVELLNSGPPYLDFRGEIIYSTAYFFICKMVAGTKQLNIYISTENEGKESIYTGIYLKNDSDGKLFAGTVIIERSQEKDASLLKSRTFSLEKPEARELDISIRHFFKAKKYNFIKNTRRYKLKTLGNWLIHKEKERGEYKIHDLFISATILSLQRRVDLFEQLGKGLIEDIDPFIDPDDRAEVHSKVYAKLEEFVLRKKNAEDIPYNPKKFHEKIIQLEENLKTKTELKNVYYSRKDIKIPTDTRFMKDSKVVYKSDFKNLLQSRAFLLVCPYPDISSSSWILLGWAMILKLPIFIVVQNPDTDLPFISRGSIGDEHLHICRISTLDDIPDIHIWLKTNGFFEKYFSKEQL